MQTKYILFLLQDKKEKLVRLKCVYLLKKNRKQNKQKTLCAL